MSSKMPGPWKHPTTNVYYFRKAVPDELRALVGKYEEKRSLRTRDLDEARRAYRRVADEIDDKWDALRAQPIPASRTKQSLTQKQASFLAGKIYADMLARYQDDPGNPSDWEKAIRRMQRALHPRDRQFEPGSVPWPTGFTFTPDQIAVRQFSAEIKKYLQQEGIDVDYPSLMKLAPAVAKNILRASQQLRRNAQGNYAPDPFAGEIPTGVMVGPAYTVDDLFRDYVKTNQPAPKTVKRWRGVMDALMLFLKKDDVRTVTEEDMRWWKDHRLALGISNRTIRDADLAAPKALFNTAIGEKKVITNPVAGITIKVKKKGRLRDQGFTADEAELILSATMEEPGGNMTVEGATARRWIPWICAYSGARVNEITQARAEDVFPVTDRNREPVWVIRITPEAGTVKDGNARIVPIHPDLIAQGFLEYVKTRKDRPLFYDPKRSRGGNAAHSQSNKVGERLAAWVRKIGVTDRSILPNHAWRHRCA